MRNFSLKTLPMNRFSAKNMVNGKLQSVISPKKITDWNRYFKIFFPFCTFFGVGSIFVKNFYFVLFRVLRPTIYTKSNARINRYLKTTEPGLIETIMEPPEDYTS